MIGFISLFIWIHFSALGSESSLPAACETPKSYNDLIICAEERSPEVQNAQLELDRSKAQVRAAGQRLNPQFTTESYQGNLSNDRRAETDISLGVPLELGGKVSARKAFAQGGVSMAEANLFQARTNVRAELLLKLHRLRQVIHEQQIAEEAIRTFSKLIRQYSKLPSLTPEQQISLSVFQLSKSDYELKRTETSDEILGLDAYLKLNIGLGFKDIEKILPQSPKSWPKINITSDGKLSPRQQILQAEFETAQAELAVAKSESWPTVYVGPSMKMQTESGYSANLAGFNISLPLPIFNVNAGGRAAAVASVKLSENRREIGLREQELRREELSRIYEQAVKTLSESISHEEIEKRHADADRLFAKGIVPSALVIEAHRTSFELERTRHIRELKALEALLGLYAIEGIILEVSL